MGALWKIRKILNNYRSQIILILTPLLLLPLILIEDEIKEVKLNPECDSLKPLCNTFPDSDELDVIDGCVLNRNETYYKVNIQRPYKCLFSLICMATYWTFEVTPLAVTSLMPMFLFPLFGLLPAARVAAHYFKDINFLFFGGLVVAIAIEKCNLHLRIALRVMKIAGAKLHTMMGAFMLVTAFLSMWISNTATTAMMLPIAVATVKTITGEQDDEETSHCSDPEADQNNYQTRPSRAKSMLSIHLARFGGFISRAQSRAGSTFVSPMNSFMNMSASQNVANQTEYAAGKTSGSPVNRRISELKKSSNPGSPKIPVPKISVTDPETGFEKPLKDDMELSPVSSGQHLDGFEAPIVKSAESLKIPDQSFQTVCGDQEQSYQQLVSRKIVKKKKSKENSTLLMKAMLLAVAYSANIGGIGTLIGTPVNLILVDQLQTVFIENKEDAGSEINFLTWMYFAVPVSIISNILCWMWLLANYVGVGKVIRDIKNSEPTPEDEKVRKDINDRYDALGKMSYTEGVVLVHFVTLAILWFTRNPKFIAGWQASFEPGHVKDSTAALLVCFSLFIFPSKPNFFRWITGHSAELDQNNMPKPAATILQWKEVQQKLAWDVIILLGAGFALADACVSSGLSLLLGEKIGILMAKIQPGLLPFSISLLISFITGFTSNTSTASVFLPILMMACVNMNINPLVLAIPVTMACSFAFILPIATPPNAIAFSYGTLETVDMIKVGTLLNFITVGVTALFLPLIAGPAFGLNEYPDWAKIGVWETQFGTNSSTLVNVTSDF